MAIIIPAAMRPVYLQRILQPAGDDWRTVHLHLYANNLTPTPATLLAEFDEVAQPWYQVAEVTLDGACFLNLLGDGEAVWDRHVWDNVEPLSTSQVIYGYYVTDVTDGILLWSERRPGGPFTMAGLGYVYPVTLRLRLSQMGA